MAALAFLLLFAALLPAVLACTTVWGGATSFFELGSSISLKAGVPPYASTGSGTGITNFNLKPAASQVYCLAVSDDPMNNAQSNVWGTLKNTVPLVIAGYGFFTGAPVPAGKSVKMTALDTLNAYLLSGFTWAQINAATGGTSAGLSGMVTGVARASNSGTTLVIKKFWNKAGAGVALTTATGILDTQAFTGCTVRGKAFRPTVSTKTGDGILYNPNGATICSAAAGANTIVYSQRAICDSCTEIALKNANGVFIKSNDAASNITQALPVAPPATNANWLAFDTFFKAGAVTPPIVSCEFMFSLVTYGGAPNAAAAKKLYVYIANNIGNLANKKANGFEPMKAKPYTTYIAGVAGALRT